MLAYNSREIQFVMTGKAQKQDWWQTVNEKDRHSRGQKITWRSLQWCTSSSKSPSSKSSAASWYSIRSWGPSVQTHGGYFILKEPLYNRNSIPIFLVKFSKFQHHSELALGAWMVFCSIRDAQFVYVEWKSEPCCYIFKILRLGLEFISQFILQT